MIRSSECIYTPPLRLVLTDRCNGRCPFCHREGFSEKGDMSYSDIMACANTAEQISIPTITLTGGEPTIVEELPHIIASLQNSYSGNINLTTNGYRLEHLASSPVFKDPLHTVSLSLSSLHSSIWLNYQRVNPYSAINNLLRINSLVKKINIVINQKNYRELKQLIDVCIVNDISLEVMFEISSQNLKSRYLEIEAFSLLSTFGQYTLKYSSTPSLSLSVSSGCTISVKHPMLSALICWPICSSCRHQSSCFERVCAVRVYPNRVVSPCLNNYFSYHTDDLYTDIANVYEEFKYPIIRKMSSNEVFRTINDI